MKKVKEYKSMKTWITSVPETGEVNSGEVLTVPDQVMSLGQMLDRLSKGLNIPAINKVATYNGEVEVPNLKRFDLTEIDDMKRNNAEKQEELKNNIRKNNDEARLRLAKEKQQEDETKQRIEE